ncbi:MAG TPA: hypothetical protein VE642_03650, partial [Pyrinomonadaceae bacterium]|nr:hypothetical protein [Pyrinomonadaceae bacterium]
GTLTPAVRDDPALGFAALSTEPVEVYTVPGNHNQIAREPHVRALAEAVMNSLGKAAAARA